MMLAWKGLLLWIHANHGAEVHHLEEALNSIANFQDAVSHTAPTLLLFQENIGAIGNDNPLTAFRTSYLDMAEITLGLLGAAREGDWLLHLASIRAMIPWCVVYDKANYALILLYHNVTPSIDHPEVHQQFMQGGFSVKLGIQNPFGRITVDQTIEETVNRDTQTAGGANGFSLNRDDVERYYLTSEYRSMYLRQLRKMVGHGMSHLSHPDLHMPRITRDEAAVQSILKLLEDDWTNHFDPNESKFVRISTGTLAPTDVARGILDAHKIGMAAYGEFKRDRLEDEMPKAQFHDKITKKRLKTFSDIRNKTSTSASNSHNVILQADRNLFAHMVLVAESRHLRMSDVLSHPLGPLSWVLANGDGTMKKTNKTALARELEKQVLPAETIPEPFATTIDGMSLVQK